MQASPKSLSMFMTATPLAQLLSMPRRAAMPPKLALTLYLNRCRLVADEGRLLQTSPWVWSETIGALKSTRQ